MGIMLFLERNIMDNEEKNVFKALWIAVPFGVLFWGFIIWLIKR